MRQPHPTVSLFNPFIGDYCDIDEGIAPLIMALWQNEIDTFMCCQEAAPGCMWIEFPTSLDAESFLELAISDRGDLYERAMQIAPRGEWEYDLAMIDLRGNIDQDDIVLSDDPDFSLAPSFLCAVSIRFPVTDYPLILANVLTAGEKRTDDE